MCQPILAAIAEAKPWTLVNEHDPDQLVGLLALADIIFKTRFVTDLLFRVRPLWDITSNEKLEYFEKFSAHQRNSQVVGRRDLGSRIWFASLAVSTLPSADVPTSNQVFPRLET